MVLCASINCLSGWRDFGIRVVGHRVFGCVSIIGGTAAITATVVKAVRTLTPERTLPRTQGATRTHTAANIARKILGRP